MTNNRFFRRRDFLKGVLAGGTAAVMTGCLLEKPEKLLPFVVPPEDIIPGQSKWYKSVCRECPAGCGVTVRQREGRAIKVEGNPDNPINEGGLCMRGQSSLQNLYNPDRFNQPYFRNKSGKLEKVSWEQAMNIFIQKLQELKSLGKMNEAVFLSGFMTGSRARLIDLWSNSLGMKKRVTYEPFSYEPIKDANELCFGKKEIPVFAIDKANYLLNFGADFLETWLSPVHYAKKFSKMRQNKSFKKFIHVEPRLSLTAANADEWISVYPGSEVYIILAICHELLETGLAKIPEEDFLNLKTFLVPYSLEKVAKKIPVSESKMRQITKELSQADSSLVLGPGMAAGITQNSTNTWIAVNLLNYMLGNINKTVLFGQNENIGQIDSHQSIEELSRQMNNNQINLLIIAGTNPAYSLPKSAGFFEAIEKVPFVVSFSKYPDETAGLADLILPDHTWLESWDDYESRVGFYGLIQPTMTPVNDTRHLGDVLIEAYQKVTADKAEANAQHEKKNLPSIPWKSYYDYLRDSWKELYEKSSYTNQAFEDFWEASLKKGGYFKAKLPEKVSLSEEIYRYEFENLEDKDSSDLFYYYPYPSIRHFDGRNANNPWLQEIPDPITSAVWDSWVEVHPWTAEKLGIKRGDLVKIKSPHGAITAPAYIYEGIHTQAIAIPTGLGHEALGRYAANVGVNAFSILSPKQSTTMVSLEKAGKKYRLVTLDGSLQQKGRKIIQTIKDTDLKHGASSHKEGGFSHTKWQMYPPHDHPTYRWGMAIDLNLCTGCGACAVACYAENNLAVVGKKQCSMGREMSWLRVERYFGRKGESINARFIPMMCQHCDNAPCEPVCPVYATYHNSEGLNVQVYNRCVGTRYCSNNCPYKVRRFNWFSWKWEKPLEQQLNPDISSREMGIMEKCTFCVQRIREGKDHAKDEKRLVRDGDIQPACAQSCPANAITFGNLKDPKSEVSQKSNNPRRYHVLEVLNTKPAVAYLKRILKT